MDWICMALLKTPKVPDRVPGSIHSHSHTGDSSYSCPGHTDRSMAAIQPFHLSHSCPKLLLVRERQ